MGILEKIFAVVLLMGFAGSSPAAPWKWIAYGDTRTDDQAHRSVLTAIKTYSPDFKFMINVGDVTENGGDIPSWQTWQTAYRDILGDPVATQNQVPPLYMAVSGNHDDVNSTGLSNWKKYLPGQNAQFGNNGVYFSFDYQNARFVLMDSEQSPTSAQLTMMNNAIRNNSKDWLFVVWHRPIFSFGTKAYDESGVAAVWGVPLYQNGCDLIFNGHAHYYARTKKLALNGQPHPPLDNLAGTAQIITGDGGAPSYVADAGFDGNSYMAASTFSGGFGYTEISVDGRNLTLRHFRTDGSLLDSAVVTANPKPGWVAAGTPTPAKTPTALATASPVPTKSPTPAATSKPTPSATSTSTPDWRLTPTYTPRPSVGVIDKPFLVYPNPAREKVRFMLPPQSSSANLKIMIYNFSGQRIAVLNFPLSAGSSRTVVWDCHNFPPGLYIAQLFLDGKEYGKRKIAVR